MIITDKQKEAILLLMDLYVNKHINKDKYFLLIEFVTGNQEAQVWNIPYIQTEPQPLDPVYGKFGRVTCDDYKVVVTPCVQNEKKQHKENVSNGGTKMKASECKCCECGKQAVAFWPVFDPDIPSYPCCRECLDKAKMELWEKLCEIDKKYNKEEQK